MQKMRQWGITAGRYGIMILCLVLCFLVEWRVLDRVTKEAAQDRYRQELDQFRQEPESYIQFHRLRKDYQVWFQEEYRKIQTDIRCFPVERSYIQDTEYIDSWYGERTFGGDRKHEGTDIMALQNVPGVIPVVSMTDGVVKNKGWLKLGGWRIGIRSDQGVYYYYAHLQSYADGLEIGDPVYAGQLLGFMGDSGYGEEGTTGMFETHLHVGIYIYDSSGTEISVNPYPFLKKLE